MSVSTFGNLRINAYLQLPAAYRSLSRPSSAPDAKAFTLCSFLLELPIRFSHSLELLEFENMGFIFSHLKGFPFSALFVIPPCGEIVVFVTLNFRKDLDLFDFAIVVSKNLLISKSFVFFLTICSFLYSFFIRFSMNRSSTQSVLCWSVWVDSNHRPRAYQARALTT